ncbi:helix-turn-helix domain-containing protein [Achromobacter sp. DMS1]|uniref:helix-turn-helix domain-containing protein n=1 Tax=Achromobacter sp. DMS1 TaxID=1688405 RepID=UPI001F45746C|nr:helix-turn-helix domain-containing protein [Achromobacter sp. DMS1]
MDAIAQRAGLSKGGVYAHFSSKEEMFEALLVRHLIPRRWTWTRCSTARPPGRSWPSASCRTCTPASRAPTSPACCGCCWPKRQVPHLAARWRRAAAGRAAARRQPADRGRAPARPVRQRRRGGASLAAAVSAGARPW